MKVQEILNANEALKALLAKNINTKLGYWASKLNKKLSADVTSYYEELKKLQDKYGEKDKDGSLKTKKEKNELGALQEVIVFSDFDAFQEERQALLDEEVKDNFGKIKLSLFLVEDKLPGNIFVALGDFVEDDTQEEEVKKGKREK